ncbi:MAG: DUF6089 family protein [Flavobacteriales bacterium]
MVKSNSFSAVWAVRGIALWMLCVFSSEAQAQKRFDQSKELGAIAGTSYYIGDLNPKRHFAGRFHPGFGGFFRYNLDSRISFRAQYFQGTVEAWDEDSNLAWQQNRNLHFRNSIQEASLLAEINYLDHKIGNPDDHLTAYLFTGLAFYAHMPEASVDGNWFPLAPLGTEGQGTTWGEAMGIEPYSTSGFSLPFGFGFKVNIGPFAAFNLEWGMRKTWTDYLDDVSTNYADPVVLLQEKGELAMQLADATLEWPEEVENPAGMQRGDPGVKDAYGFVMASLSFRVSKKPTTCWN